MFKNCFYLISTDNLPEWHLKIKIFGLIKSPVCNIWVRFILLQQLSHDSNDYKSHKTKMMIIFCFVNHKLFFCSINRTMIKKQIFNIVKRDGVEKEENEYYKEMVRIRDSCFISNNTKMNYSFDNPNTVVDGKFVLLVWI